MNRLNEKRWTRLFLVDEASYMFVSDLLEFLGDCCSSLQVGLLSLDTGSLCLGWLSFVCSFVVWFVSCVLFGNAISPCCSFDVHLIW